jgi:hypothetical protein
MDLKRAREEVPWPAITFEYERSEIWSIETLIPETKTLKDLVDVLTNQPDADCWFVKCPPLNLACKMTSRDELKQLLERIFVEHFGLQLDSKSSKLGVRMIDDLLEVGFWNQRDAELKSDKQAQADSVVFCKQSKHCAANVIENYRTFFNWTSKPLFEDLENLPLSHSLPIPYGIVTSSVFNDMYEPQTRRWGSIFKFLVRADEHLLYCQDLYKKGVSQDAIQFQIGKDQCDWATSACLALCKENPLLQAALLATHESRLIAKTPSLYSAVVMQALERARTNIRQLKQK